MTPTLIKTLKTILMAAAAAALDALVQNIPTITAIIPPKYANVGAVLAIAATLYHKAPPSGSGGTPAGAAGLGAILLLLCGALPQFLPMADRPQERGRASSYAAISLTRPVRLQILPDAGLPERFFNLAEATL